MTYGDLLKKLKDQRSLSEDELAERSGVKRATLHQYLLGLRMPTFANAIKISLGLGVSLDTFVGCEFTKARGVKKR
jgi:transcriptional regulator with XRE-family HTH domain